MNWKKMLLSIIPIVILSCNGNSSTGEVETMAKRSENIDYSGLWIIHPTPEIESLTGEKIKGNCCMQLNASEGKATLFLIDGRKFQLEVESIENDKLLFAKGNIKYKASMRNEHFRKANLSYLTFDRPQRHPTSYDGWLNSDLQDINVCVRNIKEEEERAESEAESPTMLP